MSAIALLRKKLDGEVFDYPALLSALAAYSKPRDKITRLLADGEVLRIRKGLYCFGEAFRREAISREYVANLIFGPSCVSLEYALGFHGLIPERVEALTSVTTRRSRAFATPLGRFTYETLNERRYAVGVELHAAGSTRFLMASPEKALADKVWKDKRFDGQRVSEYDAYLVDDLRIEPETLAGLDDSRLRAIAAVYQSPKIHNLLRFILQLKADRHA